MRPTIYLTSLSALLALALTGPAGAAPVYAPVAADSPLGSAEVSVDVLWKLMTNEGADGSAWEAALRSSLVGAPVTTFTDLAAYNSAVGEHDVITFSEDVVSAADILGDQYTPVGASFLDGTDQVLSNTLFVADQLGAAGWGDFTLGFSALQAHLGVEFPGELRIELYSGEVSPGNLIWSGDFGGPDTTGNFAGVIPEDAFDYVVLSDPGDSYAFIDNLHYVVPEPGALALLGLGALGVIRRGGSAGRRR